MVQTLDMSVQKNWNIGEGSKKKIQLRVDALNVLNHPVFRNPANVGGGTDIFSNPSFAWTAATLQTVYTTWQGANSTLASPVTTPAGLAQFNALQQMILSHQSSTGTLPNNFYSVPVPAHFQNTPASSFNILDPTRI